MPTTAPATAPAINPVALPVDYRAFARKKLGSTDLRLQGIKFRGRWAIIFSAEDFSHGLLGQSADGIFGYSPACATEMLRRIIANSR